MGVPEYRCEGCGNWLSRDEVTDDWHEAVGRDAEGQPVPHQCGPVGIGPLARRLAEAEELLRRCQKHLSDSPHFTDLRSDVRALFGDVAAFLKEGES